MLYLCAISNDLPIKCKLFRILKDLTGGKLQYVHIKVSIRMAKKVILILDKWFLHWIHCSLVKLTVIV